MIWKFNLKSDIVFIVKLSHNTISVACIQNLYLQSYNYATFSNFQNQNFFNDFAYPKIEHILKLFVHKNVLFMFENRQQIVSTFHVKFESDIHTARELQMVNRNIMSYIQFETSLHINQKCYVVGIRYLLFKLIVFVLKSS